MVETGTPRRENQILPISTTYILDNIYLRLYAHDSVQSALPACLPTIPSSRPSSAVSPTTLNFETPLTVAKNVKLRIIRFLGRDVHSVGSRGAVQGASKAINQLIN